MIPRPVSAAEAARRLEPLGRYPHLAVAVSGGADSLALLHLLARWRPERGAQPALTVMTVDHGLRAESRHEAETVAEAAAKLGLPHAILTWTDPKPHAGGLQARARAARYDLMAGFCHAHGVPALVTAHHLDDQAETFLMRLKRGSGLDGLAAIPEEGAWTGIAIHRPLLDVAKERLIATLHDIGLGWTEDASNADRRFERVLVRAERDAFAQLGLSPAALARSAMRLRRARTALERGTDDFLAAHATVHAAGFVTLPPQALATAPAEIALRALGRVLGSVGGRAEPIRLSKLEALLAALRDEPARSAHTLGGCRIVPHADGLGMFREARRTGLPEFELKPGERALWDNRFSVALAKSESAPAIVRAFGAGALGDAPEPWLEALPRFARITLPVCARGDVLMLPRLGSVAPTRSEPGFSADFVGGRDVLTALDPLKEACTTFA